jgi:hypothetical protein
MKKKSSSRYRDHVIKQMTGYLVKSLTDNKVEGSLPSAKEFLSALASIAGKGKDDLVQTICREIGQATAAVLKEPIAEILRDRRLQVTIELVPIDYEKEKAEQPPKARKKASPTRSPRE